MTSNLFEPMMRQLNVTDSPSVTEQLCKWSTICGAASFWSAAADSAGASLATHLTRKKKL